MSNWSFPSRGVYPSHRTSLAASVAKREGLDGRCRRLVAHRRVTSAPVLAAQANARWRKLDLPVPDQILQDRRNPVAHDIRGEQASRLRNEFVIQAHGEIVRRAPETVNPGMATGEIELQATDLKIVSRSTPLPFQLDEEGVDETLRLRDRWLDLRREKMQRNIRMRAKLISIIRAEMEADGFVDIETPIMAKPTPEGARDFLVPTRLQPGRFFALPQSPQIYKQLLVISGFERYYQIARCFRDEDLRADRLQELTQLDVQLPILASVLPSNQLQIERGVQAVVEKGNKKVGILGFSFKAGTDDLRESPMVELTERLIGKGFDLRVYDRNVSLACLHGANRDYILNKIPHISRLMVPTIDDVLAHAETIVIGNGAPEFSEVPKRIGEGQTIIDFVRVCDSRTILGTYEGICW